MCYDRIECRIGSTQEWVPYENRVPQDEDALRIWGIGSQTSLYTEFEYGDFGNPKGWNAQKMADAKVWAQEHVFDRRVRVADLPLNHWAKEADPATNCFFWEWWKSAPADTEEWWFVERHHNLFLLEYNDTYGLVIGVERVVDV